MYKAFIEPDLKMAHIKIVNKFNPFTGFQSPTYILKVLAFSLYYALMSITQWAIGSSVFNLHLT